MNQNATSGADLAMRSSALRAHPQGKTPRVTSVERLEDGWGSTWVVIYAATWDEATQVVDQAAQALHVAAWRGGSLDLTVIHPDNMSQGPAAARASLFGDDAACEVFLVMLAQALCEVGAGWPLLSDQHAKSLYCPAQIAACQAAGRSGEVRVFSGESAFGGVAGSANTLEVVTTVSAAAGGAVDLTVSAPEVASSSSWGLAMPTSAHGSANYTISQPIRRGGKGTAKAQMGRPTRKVKKGGKRGAGGGKRGR